MRPPNKAEEEGEAIAEKISADSLSILGKTFTFDSVADAESTQASWSEVQLFVLHEQTVVNIICLNDYTSFCS